MDYDKIASKANLFRKEERAGALSSSICPSFFERPGPYY
jgi:hypothetical protein